MKTFAQQLDECVEHAFLQSQDGGAEMTPPSPWREVLRVRPFASVATIDANFVHLVLANTNDSTRSSSTTHAS